MRCALLELSQVLNPGVPDDLLPPIMAVGVYCDESETKPPHPRLFTLAGWVAVPSAWGQFNEAWRSMLACCGPHPVRAFHMAKLVNEQDTDSEYIGWSRGARDAMIERAAQILVDPKIMGELPYAVAATVAVDDYLEHAPGLLWNVEDLYVHCYDRLFLQVVSWPRVQRDFSFVFDKKKGVEHRVLERFSHAQKQLNAQLPADERLLRGCSFDNDEIVLQLQAADFLAYEVRRSIFQKRTNPARAERRCYAELKKRPHSFRCYGKTYLENLFKACAAGQPLSEAMFSADAPEDC